MHSYSTIGGMHHHESTDRNSKSINALILSSFPWIKIPWIKRGKKKITIYKKGSMRLTNKQNSKQLAGVISCG